MPGMKTNKSGSSTDRASLLIAEALAKRDCEWQEFMATPEGTWAWLTDDIKSYPPAEQLKQILKKNYE